MSHELIAKKLENTMGLSAPTVGMVTISSAIDKRMRACKIDNDHDYFARINSDVSEMKQLIETVIVPETWFFRESEPFSYILKYINTQQQTSPIKILSMPCSTGEEPYSIAMMLMANGVHASKYTIDAIDIAEKNLTKAKLGKYKKNSFRSQDLGFIKDYFHQDNKTFTLSANVKHQVNFHCGNVLDPTFSLSHQTYDIIFCRNLLIYFDVGTQEKMFATLSNMLNATGILILGHAETIPQSNDIFFPAINSKSYVYVKKDNLEILNINKHHRQKSSHQEKRATTRPVSIEPRPFSTQNRTLLEKKTNTQDSSKQQLDRAFEMANQGKLTDALIECKNYLIKNNNSSRAYYLCGVIYDTQGSDNKAKEYLRKAIYLDPKNIEALIHLSLLTKQQGDHAEALRLKLRAKRARERQTE